MPLEMQNEEVRPYYEALQNKKIDLFCKIIFDRVVSFLMFIVLIPIFLVLAIWIKVDSPGEIFFRQRRVTQYGKVFSIHKFRTMVKDADKKGSLVTTNEDSRVTKVGKCLRWCRLDELPQLIDIMQGNMSFVGTRPEVEKYVNQYTPEMKATLLLLAGVTSKASIEYKDEEKLLSETQNADKCYLDKVLPEKMKWNLKAIEEFSFIDEVKTMINTLGAVI